ncbi:MAG: SDR family oxidoreductase [Hyphomonadaceae bacterium]|nr:SDR family oxidoreductase [Hyphomonadaceae bacterium]
MEFKDRTVIVTGGGRGIGRGITTAFALNGADVIICGRSQPEPFDVKIKDKIHFIEADIREAEAAKMIVEAAVAKTGRLDTLINNAGGGPPVASADASPRLTEKVIALNLLAPIYLSQAAYAVMKDNLVRGSIINISSVSATRSSPGSVAYGAAKAGLLNVTTSLAMEWAPEVRVNAIIAGLIETEASESHYGGKNGMKYLADALPMKRMGTPDDIAKACMFLADSENSYVSGACLEVFGGGEPPSFLKIAEEAHKLG